MALGSERRKYTRLSVRLPMEVTGGPESAQFIDRTTTTQVGIGAVYFRTKSWALMPPGTRVFVVLDSGDGDGTGDEFAAGTVGRVVRVDRPDPKATGEDRHVGGVAVELERLLNAEGWKERRRRRGLLGLVRRK